MKITISLTLKAIKVSGTMMKAQQTLVIGGLTMNQEITGGHKTKTTAQSRLTTVTHHLMISTVSILINMVNSRPGGGTTLLKQVVTGPVRMDLILVIGPVMKAQQLLAPGGLMMDQNKAHGLKTKMIQALNAILLHLHLANMMVKSSMKMVKLLHIGTTMKPEKVATGQILMDLTLEVGDLMMVAITQEPGGTIKKPHKEPGHQMLIMTPKDTLCLLLEIMMAKSTTGMASMWLIGI